MISEGADLNRIPVTPILDARLRPIWGQAEKICEISVPVGIYFAIGFILPISNIYPENQEKIT
jgi:hypothetical protein